MTRGKKIAEGWEAEIYEWGDGATPKVLKLFLESGADTAQLERDNLAAARRSGAPVPEVFGDLVQVGGRSGFVMERVAGVDMDRQIAARPFHTEKAGRQLGELHAALHRAGGTRLRKSRKEFMAFHIERASAIGESAKGRVLEMLSGLPEGDSICHGDLHFGNVIVGRGRSSIIDWSSATMGDPMSDVAKTQLLITTSWIGVGLADRLLPGMVRRLKMRLCRSYTDAYFEASGRTPADVDQWRTVTAAARLGEGLPAAQERAVAALVHQGLASRE